MATIDSKDLIDKIISNDGFYENDARVAQIVEYTNAYGKQTYGVTWQNETYMRQLRYEEISEFVKNPKVIWRAPELIGEE